MELEFLKALVIIFGVSAISVLILHKLRVPPIIGFILAGVLIGPHGAGLISDAHEVEILAEIGVILLLFTVGIEFSLKKLILIRNVVFFSGGAQVLLTIVVTAALWYPFVGNRSVIFFGFITALSSTAIVMKALSDSGQTDSPHGRKMMGILIFQDICVVPLMLITPVLGGESAGTKELLYILLNAVGIILFVLMAAKWIVPSILHQVVKTRSRELFLITVIFICLGTALLTSKFGLSMALGAFLAGLVLSESEYAYQATAEILPFKDSFLGIFFVSIGMLMDTAFIMDNLALVVGSIAFILIVKSIVASLSILITSANPKAAIHAAIGLAQVGEFSFVLAAAGKHYGLMSDHYFQLFLSASVLTMVLTPFMMMSAGSMASWLVDHLPFKGITEDESEYDSASNLTDHVIIIGFGLNGKNLAITLKSAGIPYVVLDLNSVTVRTESEKGENIFYGDATRLDVLKKLGVDNARALVIAISDPTASRHIVSIVRSHSPSIYIIVRTRYMAEVEDLSALGADEIIPEEFETSVEIFARVLNHMNIPRNIINDHINDVRHDEYHVLRNHDLPGKKASDVHNIMGLIETDTLLIRNHSLVNGKSIKDIDLRNKTGVTIIAIERDEELLQNPPADYVIKENDIIVLMGRKDQICATMEYLDNIKCV